MTDAAVQIDFVKPEAAALATAAGRIALVIPPEGRLDPVAGRIDRATGRALTRLRESARWRDLPEGGAEVIGWPAGLGAEALVVVKLSRKADALACRHAGGAIAAGWTAGDLTVLAPRRAAAGIAFGIALRAWSFERHKGGERPQRGGATLMTAEPEAVAAEYAPMRARAEGVLAARALVDEPANVLSTGEFARRIEGMADLGLEVEILDETELERLGMRLLLSVGQGSETPSRVAILTWRGGGDGPVLALCGKGVVFDTGGISLKPGAGMEEMTGDMAGAATVVGLMRTLALRKARANVVGLVGLVENMPSGRATRPGDVVRSMKGETVEIINTDAEGRLVLADLLWHAQERFAPSAVIDLATLTGAIVVALGTGQAGVFASDDDLAARFLAAAGTEGEGAWRMPLGKDHADRLKSRIADMKNVGGREGGASIAAEFLRRFVKEGMPWMHLDIAGVAWGKADGPLCPKGATGWGVLALDRMIADHHEAGS